MELFALFLIFSPAYLEVILDKILWKNNLPDKPISTIFRWFLFIFLAVLFEVQGINSWWQTLLLVSSVHFLMFDYLINLARNKRFFYVSRSNHWYEKIRRALKYPIIELMIKIWVVLVMYGVYAHLDWIY